MWTHGALEGKIHYLGSAHTFSNGGGFGSSHATGEAIADPIYVPPNVSYHITAAWVGNQDTTSDANFRGRIGLYEISATDLTLSLIQDIGSFTKDTTAVTTPRQVGSTLDIDLEAGKLYCTVFNLEVAKAGASLGFYSISSRAPWATPWGCIGDNSSSDFLMTTIGTDMPYWTGVNTSALPSTLAVPTSTANLSTKRAPAVMYTVGTETQV